MKSVKYSVLLAGLLSLLGLVACGGGQSEKTSADTSGVAATADGMPISENMYKVILDKTGGMETPESRKNILEQLAVQRVVAEQAIKLGLDKQPEIAGRLELTRQATLGTAYVQDYMKKNPVTDAMLQAEYDRVTAQSRGQEYLVRHIMVGKEADAKEIIAALKKDPKAFSQLARQKSTDKGSAENDGSLGWLEPHGKDPALDAAIVAVPKGKFTETPVKSQFGWHVIAVDDVRAKQTPAFEKVKMTLRQRAEQEAMEKMLDKVKAGTKIEIAQKAAPVTAAPAAAAPVSAAPITAAPATTAPVSAAPASAGPATSESGKSAPAAAAAK
jgi:peptidyl-prolyl cis-trans isomerase C